MHEICELSSETTSSLSICLSLFSRQEGVSVSLPQVCVLIRMAASCDGVSAFLIIRGFVFITCTKL